MPGSLSFLECFLYGGERVWKLVPKICNSGKQKCGVLRSWSETGVKESKDVPGRTKACLARPSVSSSRLPDACENPKSRNESDSFPLFSAPSIWPWDVTYLCIHGDKSLVMSQYLEAVWDRLRRPTLNLLISPDVHQEWGKYCMPFDVVGLQLPLSPYSQWSRMMAALVQQHLEGHCFNPFASSISHILSQSTTWVFLKIKMKSSIYVFLSSSEEGQRHKQN